MVFAVDYVDNGSPSFLVSTKDCKKNVIFSLVIGNHTTLTIWRMRGRTPLSVFCVRDGDPLGRRRFGGSVAGAGRDGVLCESPSRAALQYSPTRRNDFVRNVDPAGARPKGAFDPLLALWSTPDPAGQYMDPYGFGDPVNGVDLYGLWKLGLGITIGWDSKSGFSIGFGVAADIDKYSNVDLSATRSFRDNSWTYTAGGSVNVNVYGWNLYGGGSYSYNTNTGSTVSGFSGANYMGYGGGETGGSLYWDKSGNYQGATLYQEFYGGAFGFRSGTGYEWGFGGMEGRGWYQEASGHGLYASYAQNGGLSYGGNSQIANISYDSETGYSYHHVGQDIMNLYEKAKEAHYARFDLQKEWEQDLNTYDKFLQYCLDIGGESCMILENLEASEHNAPGDNTNIKGMISSTWDSWSSFFNRYPDVELVYNQNTGDLVNNWARGSYNYGHNPITHFVLDYIPSKYLWKNPY